MILFALFFVLLYNNGNMMFFVVLIVMHFIQSTIDDNQLNVSANTQMQTCK